MLQGRVGGIFFRPLHTEMVVNLSGVNGSSGLRDQLSTPHIAVPFRGLIDSDLSTLLRGCIRWIAEVRR